MSGYSIERFYESTYTLYRCSPLFRFPSDERGYNNFERLVAKKLYDSLGLYIEGHIEDLKETVKGKITTLRFQPIELEDFEYDKSIHSNPPLLFELEFQLNSKKKLNQYSFLMLPATQKPETKAEELFWHYPLILTKLNQTLLNLIESIFDKKFDARLEVLKSPPKVMESLITKTVESIYGVYLQDFEYLSNGVDDEQFSTLKLEYLTHSVNIRCMRLNIEPDQILKICKLTKEPTKFYTVLCQHISNTTKINVNALQLSSISCHVASLSITGKLKLHTYAPRNLAYDLIYLLIELAGTRTDVISWV